MTLGAILMLGGASGAGAEDVSSLWSGAALSGFDGVLPAMPQNWSELPFQINVKQSLSYNSNIFNTPGNGLTSVTGVPFTPVASFINLTNFGASAKFYVGPQQFFADGNYGIYRYLDHGSLNASHNSGDFGVNWVLTSRCSGQLVAAAASSPALPGTQLGVNVLNILSTESFNETGTCSITGNWSGIFNSGVTRSTNSASVDAVNNFQNAFAAAGIRYAVSETNTLQVLVTISQYTFPNSSALLTLLNSSALNNPNALASSSIAEKNVNFSYTKNFGPNLSVIASIGAVTATGGGKGDTGIQPQFSLSATWTPTAKLSFNGSVARVVTPPTAIVGNLQTTESVNAGMTYALTPKMAFSAGAVYSRFSSGLGATTPTAVQTVLPYLSASRVYSFNTALNYTMTPFLNANLSYQYFRTVQANLTTPTSIVMLALSYAPH